MKLHTPAACLLLVGCMTSGAASTPSPRSPDWEGPVVIRVPENAGSEDVLNLPEGALTSEVALVSADSESACFDIKMRTWQGAAPVWEVELTVDHHTVQEENVVLRPCTQASSEASEPLPMTLSCLPVDSAVGWMATDVRESVKVRGDRVCMKHGGQLATRSESITLSMKQGAMAYQFEWQLSAHRGAE